VPSFDFLFCIRSRPGRVFATKCYQTEKRGICKYLKIRWPWYRTDDLFHFYAMELAKPYLAGDKGFNSLMSRQEPLKSARFDTKLGQGMLVADRPLFLSDGPTQN
jgi:hypothetical protein